MLIRHGTVTILEPIPNVETNSNTAARMEGCWIGGKKKQKKS
jgi:hypothetical protein